MDGMRQAYFKVMNLGNYMEGPLSTPSVGSFNVITTNYQYSFYVPIEGNLTGILNRGELQETGYVKGESDKITAIQRQLTMSLIK